MAGNRMLREALDQATKLTCASQYRAEIERLREVFAHSITVLPHDYSRFARGEPEPSCYALALGLADNAGDLELVAAAARRDKRQPITSNVMTDLIKAKVLRRRRAAHEIGDVVLYIAGDAVQHGGVVIDQDDRIRSKWGQAEVHEHALWEVPLGYGDRHEVYVASNPARILEHIDSNTHSDN